MDPQTKIELGRAQEMHEFIADKIAGKYPSDDRAVLFASFLSLAQSHHEAILVLCQNDQLMGSAYALYRPLVEVVNRGLFVAFLATPEQIRQIKRGRTPYGEFNQLVKRLDKFFSTKSLFSGHAGEAWKKMCGFTHGGVEQLIWRVGANGEIGCHFQQSDIQRLLASSTGELFKIAFQFAGGLIGKDAAEVISAKYISIYSDKTES